MGIKNLKKLILLKARNGVVKRHLREYNGKILAVDTSIYIYKYLSYNNDVLGGFIRLILHLLKYNITPVFVFDGKPPIEKLNIIKQRRNIKQNNMLVCNIYRDIINYVKSDIELDETIINNKYNITNANEYINDYAEHGIAGLTKIINQLTKSTVFITNEHITQLQELFTLFNVQYIIANGEAETVCAMLSRNGLIEGCISEDTDILPNGGKKLITSISIGNSYVEEYNLNEILKHMDITHLQFIDLCILCGCDYVTNIEKIGYISAYNNIIEYRTIENIVDYLNTTKKYIVPENYNELYTSARNIFKSDITYTLKTYDSLGSIKLQSDILINNKYNIDNILHFIYKNNIQLNNKYINTIKSLT